MSQLACGYESISFLTFPLQDLVTFLRRHTPYLQVHVRHLIAHDRLETEGLEIEEWKHVKGNRILRSKADCKWASHFVSLLHNCIQRGYTWCCGSIKCKEPCQAPSSLPCARTAASVKLIQCCSSKLRCPDMSLAHIMIRIGVLHRIYAHPNLMYLSFYI